MSKSKSSNRKRGHKSRRCDHYWCYERELWSATRNDESTVAIGRYCSKCGKLQTAIAKDWHRLPVGYVDMREQLLKSSGAKP